MGSALLLVPIQGDGDVVADDLYPKPRAFSSVQRRYRQLSHLMCHPPVSWRSLLPLKHQLVASASIISGAPGGPPPMGVSSR